MANPWIAVVLGALFGGFFVSGGNDTPVEPTSQNRTPETDSAEISDPERSDNDTVS